MQHQWFHVRGTEWMCLFLLSIMCFQQYFGHVTAFRYPNQVPGCHSRLRTHMPRKTVTNSSYKTEERVLLGQREYNRPSWVSSPRPLDQKSATLPTEQCEERVQKSAPNYNMNTHSKHISLYSGDFYTTTLYSLMQKANNIALKNQNKTQNSKSHHLPQNNKTEQSVTSVPY